MSTLGAQAEAGPGALRQLHCLRRPEQAEAAGSPVAVAHAEAAGTGGGGAGGAR